ncbi:MAG: serine hydrolase domain-containing protein [Actinomycetota bacterium]|nr:serine hydrolase domain-containing protein [Actinomycetota bacterium]
MTIEGFVAPGWEGVRDAFAENLSVTEEVGAGTAVYHRGEKVIDLTGGWFDEAQSRPYDADVLQLVFSTTKGITAIAVGMCVQRGLLAYDQPVSRYWPEFAAHDKGAATVAQLLSHQCGLFSVQGELTMDDALDWDTITSRLADTAPEWPIGSTHGYHAVTFGFLAGELVRRVDPHHRNIGRFVQDEIAGPLGVEFYIGLPEHLEPRVSPLIGGMTTQSDDPNVQAMIDMFMGPESNAGRALSLNGALAGEGLFNTRAVHAAEIPAANGITNAASLARIYAATLGPIDGVQLLDEATRDVARTTVTPVGEADACLVVGTTFGMGFMTSGMFSPFAGPGSYGHPGAGGSVGFAHPEHHLAVGYVMNRMAANLASDVRAQRITDAAVAAAVTAG